MDAIRAHRELEMTESGLLLLSGGCLQKALNFLRSKISSESPEAVFCRAFEVGQIIQMTSDEKTQLHERLEDAFLKYKDFGNLKFPKIQFLPVIRQILKLVQITANCDVFRAFPHRTVAILKIQRILKKQKFLKLFDRLSN